MAGGQEDKVARGLEDKMARGQEGWRTRWLEDKRVTDNDRTSLTSGYSSR